MFWNQTIDAERSYLDLMQSRLLDLHTQSQKSGHADLKQIYAGAKAAHDKASAALNELVRDGQTLETCVKTGQLPEQLRSLASGFSPMRNRAAAQAMGVLRCLKMLPSDVFRHELRLQSQAFMTGVHALVQDPKIPDAELSQYMEGIGEVLCGLDQVNLTEITKGVDDKKPSWMTGALKIGAIATVAWKVRDWWTKRT